MRYLVVCSFPLLVFSAACSAAPPPADASGAKAADVKGLFAQACAKCHGADGSGGLPMGAGAPKPIDLRDRAWQSSRSDAEIAAAIRDGRGAMPPFRDVLSAADVEALAAFVRTLPRSVTVR